MSPSEQDIKVADKIADDLVEHWGMDLGCLHKAIAQALATAREQAVKPYRESLRELVGFVEGLESTDDSASDPEPEEYEDMMKRALAALASKEPRNG